MLSFGSPDKTNVSRLASLTATVTFNVTAPGFAIVNVLMCKDTAITPGFGLPNYVLAPTTNVTVTITSSDPSRQGSCANQYTVLVRTVLSLSACVAARALTTGCAR